MEYQLQQKKCTAPRPSQVYKNYTQALPPNEPRKRTIKKTEPKKKEEKKKKPKNKEYQGVNGSN